MTTKFVRKDKSKEIRVNYCYLIILINNNPDVEQPVFIIPANPVREGATVTLSCSSASANPAVTTYKFFKGDDEMKSGTESTHTFPAVKADNGMEYKCSTTNSAGLTKTSKMKKLLVYCRFY